MFKIIILTLFFSCNSQNSIDLKTFRWEKRIVCIESNDRNFIENQLSTFKKFQKECKERKLIFFIKISDNYYKDLSLEAVTAVKGFPLNRKNKVYTLSLIGLDGEMKYKWDNAINANELFDVIDAMPMRINEIKIK
jgi:hypothetical protein